jgi:putative ABC transport system permease protein
MNLNIRPLLSALSRNPMGATLAALQVAITLAVLVNATWIVGQRLHQMEQPTGLDTQDTFAIEVSTLSNRFDVARAQSEDLAYLRGLSGVASATASIGIPLTGYGSQNASLWSEAGQRGTPAHTNVLDADDQTLSTLGVSLVAGRSFRSTEIQPFGSGKPPSEIIVTQALAHALFPRGSALGRTVYDSGANPFTIVGIARDFMGVVCECGEPLYHTALLPETAGAGGFYAYLVRTRPGRLESVLHEARQHIGVAHRDAVINTTMTLRDAKEGFDTDDRNMSIFLTGVTALMLAVCSFGIFGLTTFNVGSRTRQIGTRRAVGARRRDITDHFLVENALILAAGTLLGSGLALGIGVWLTAHYGLPRLDLGYLLSGVAVLWVIGQLAAWQPARRAALVEPSVATRTV